MSSQTGNGEAARGVLDRVDAWMPGGRRGRPGSRDEAKLREDLGVLRQRLDRANARIPYGNVQLSPHVRGLAKMVGCMEMMITRDETNRRTA